MLAEEKLPADSLEVSDRLSKGLDRVTASGIDAILLDLGLPDSQGISTFEKMYTAAQKTPILILTAFKDDVFALEAVRRGAQDYLIKGKIDGALLIRAVTYAIERKKTAEAVKRQAELIDLSPDAILIKKPDDTITFWSLGAEKLYGWTKSEAVGQKTNALLNTNFTQPFESIYDQLKQKGKWSGELTHYTKSGRALAIQSYWLAKLDQQQCITEIFESNVDVTERKDAERLAAIGQTAGMVGHDIRNPLQSILSELYLAKAELPALKNEEVKNNLAESLSNIEHDINYINKIVQDLQDFAKPLKPAAKKIDLGNLCHELIHKTNMPKNIKAICEVEDAAQQISTDPDILKRIIVNLFTNAVQAMPEGGKLTLHAHKNLQSTLITVQDTGVGIPEDIRSKMFTPLFTTKSKGQGFGLAVVKRLTESLGGTVTFESELGKGTKFILEFPAKPQLRAESR